MTQRVTVVGAGVIGASWTALFLAHGLHVTVCDIAPDSEARLHTQLRAIEPTLHALGLPPLDTSHLLFEPHISKAVVAADVVQECGPERRGFKRDLWRRVEQAAPPQALLLSSSSGIPVDWQSTRMRDPARLLIGHPVNPPHLMPLVEVVAGSKTASTAVDEAIDFYRAVGKHPVRLRKPIPGFVVNRLQSALMREAVALVRAGVVTVDELDDIVTHSVGPRWAATGPFESFHLGGGPTGFAGFLKAYAGGMQLLWLHSSLRPVWFTPSVRRRLREQVDAGIGTVSITELEARRDRRQLAVLRASRETTAMEEGSSRV
ncbi:3-hydroxyacyl-CoA dehydrogenase NAD-binding domain-containing protein [Nocardia cyriacigeorgica]|uniref:3-hydroxyacyl-CoA dehydrogenase NAD-binding domain-containing protein n=1 Tax=Nocardia cyriacigeorgica TaxID=135487 RepID=UPI001BB0F180|nr:3-hydroxyacyl-CoA dehydrogenase NAD-binding domain-containing protein [Nocardia cyriacigeorgica]